jgi:hypothetical protein
MNHRLTAAEDLDILVARARDARKAARWEEATALHRAATREAVRLGRPRVVVESLNALGAIAFELGDREQALTYLEMSAGTLSDPEITSVFIEIARRESFGPDKRSETDSHPPMSPEQMARTFAALPAGDWTRIDEELVRT